MSASGTFTAHNIVLPDGTETLPGRPLISESPVMKAALRTMALVFQDRQPSTISVLDIGCLEGGYTVEFARAGYQATGLEVRSANIENCEAVAKALALSNLRFVQDDARNVENHGSFDAIFCSGLLYHLDSPTTYLRTLERCARRLLILQTHYATRRRPPLWRLYKPFQFSALTMHEGNRGRWYREYGTRASKAKIEGARWASYGNPKSFWIEKSHLLETLRRVGFSLIFEQYDAIPDVVNDPYIRKHHRSMFIAIK